MINPGSASQSCWTVNLCGENFSQSCSWKILNKPTEDLPNNSFIFIFIFSFGKKWRYEVKKQRGNMIQAQSDSQKPGSEATDKGKCQWGEWRSSKQKKHYFLHQVETELLSQAKKTLFFAQSGDWVAKQNYLLILVTQRKVVSLQFGKVWCCRNWISKGPCHLTPFKTWHVTLF